ncbi:MAG: hypothetical protein RBT69_11985 [Spirochaetia bacterium]|jgi:DNA mismatch repair protein MutS2|nr:hypothetical protein [Spirochaetia bacterium]
MVQHTLELLEFEKITENIAQYCLSEAGAALLLKQTITNNEKIWKERSSAAFAVKKIFDDSRSLPDVRLPDIGGIIRKGSVEGSVLDCTDVALILNYLISSSSMKKSLITLTDNFLIHENLDFEESSELTSYLSKYVTKEGVFRDENVKELKEIRVKIGNVNKTINKIVSSFTNNPLVSPSLQENSSTIRDNRVVLPVRENFKGKIKGIVHSSSSRGMTLFIEPVELFEYNNEIIELEERYRIEILRILRIITEKIRENSEIINDIFRKITFLDTIIARGRFAYINKCIMPEIIEKGIVLKNARHFLLGKNAVPVDIIITENTKALLISGPNTGGKTVALKTAGLSILMNQFCTGVLADEGSSVSMVDNVLADIGDEQSITGSLSTFSAHMKNIAEILNLSTDKSFVLLDEPGSGTDPDEGSAISMAVFDILLERETVFLATTHQGTLKNYAAGRDDIVNVSVAYERETYKPEYRIVYNLPGESFGIDIAQKSGIGSEVISSARKYLGSEKVNINQLLKEISIKQQEFVEKEKKFEEIEKQIIEEKRKTALKELSIRRMEYELRNTENRAVNSFLRESRQKIESVIKKLIEHGADEQSRKEAREFIDNIKEREEIFESRTEKPDESDEITDDLIEPGNEVYVGDKKKKGEVIRILKNGKFLVAVGSMKIEVEKKELIRIKTGKGRETSRKAVLLHH